MNEFIATQCERVGEVVAYAAPAKQQSCMTQYTPAQARELAALDSSMRVNGISPLGNAIRSLADQVEELQRQLEAVGAGGVQRLGPERPNGICSWEGDTCKCGGVAVLHSNCGYWKPAANLRPDPSAVKTCATCSQCTRHRGGNVCQLHRCATSLDSYCKDWNAVTKDTK